MDGMEFSIDARGAQVCNLDGAQRTHDRPTCVVLPPAPELDGLVAAYWYLRDWAGVHAHRETRTTPHPAAVLTLHLGRPHRTGDGTTVPGASLFGLQSRARVWRSGPETCYAAAMITVPGLAELFPGQGPRLADRLCDLGDVIGADAGALHAAVKAAATPHAIARVLDDWLLDRRRRFGTAARHRPYAAAVRELRSHGRVQLAASRAGVSTRQLQRWTRLHGGVTPKQLVDLERLQLSVRRVQTAVDGGQLDYSDQSHEIRAWKRRLAVTPGDYRRSGASPLARHFGHAQQQHGSFVAHFL
jgi:AraC-like DNA-binding protein